VRICPNDGDRPCQDRLASDAAAFDEYAVNRYKPLNSNRKTFFESRFWFRPKACRNGFFTFQIAAAPNQALLSHGFSHATMPFSGMAGHQKVFIRSCGAIAQSMFPSLLAVPQYLFALTKRCFLHLLPRF
jgi:hypothetical protein